MTAFWPWARATIIADRGGIAAGRDVIITGVLPDQLNAAVADAIRPLVERIDSAEALVNAISRVINDAAVPPEMVSERVAGVVESFATALHEVCPNPGDDEAVAQFKREAHDALRGGDFDRADAQLAAAASAQKPSETDTRLATTLASRGDVAMMRLRYREAASLFAEAARSLPEKRKLPLFGYLSREIKALCRQGEEFGDNLALKDAIERCRILLKIRPRNEAPLQWAMIQDILGGALQIAGERGDTDALQQAVSAYEAALLEYTRERAPQRWAGVQNNLGDALRILGERDDDELLSLSVESFELSLEVFTRERSPDLWATVQNNLGNALAALGERSGDEATLRQAVGAFETSLEVRTRTQAPLQWALTQNNLGDTLRALGRLGDEAALRKAASVLEESLEVCTRQRLPMQWAMTQNNLGNALRMLGELGDNDALQRAIVAFEEALQEFTPDQSPMDWLMARSNLGAALAVAGDRGDDEALRRALETLQDTLAELSEWNAPSYRGIVERNLARIRATCCQHQLSQASPNEAERPSVKPADCRIA